MPADWVDTALTEIAAAASPADPRFVAVELERTLELFGKPDNWDAIVAFYFDIFDDVAADLVRLAFYRLRRSWQRGPRTFPTRLFPLPGDIRALVEQEVGERRSLLAKAQVAKLRNRGPEISRLPPSEEEKRQVDAAMARIRANLSERGDAMRGAPRRERPEYRPTPEAMAASRHELGLETAPEIAEPEVAR